MQKDKASIYDIVDSMRATLRYVRGKSVTDKCESRSASYPRMRKLTALSALVVATIVLAQTRPALTPMEHGVLGSWKSPDLGLDFPIWMVDTYAADGTVRIDFYSKPREKEIHHKDKTRQARWRIQNNALEVGKFDDAGAFKRDGQPRPIKTDASERVTSIEGWTRVPPPATQPTSTPSGGK